MLYLDSSALVKLYVNELFSIEMQQLAQAASVALSRDGYVEVRAAFASAERGHFGAILFEGLPSRLTRARRTSLGSATKGR
jgi:predicted nucleic acid-binding protein